MGSIRQEGIDWILIRRRGRRKEEEESRFSWCRLAAAGSVVTLNAAAIMPSPSIPTHFPPFHPRLLFHHCANMSSSSPCAVSGPTVGDPRQAANRSRSLSGVSKVIEEMQV